MLTPNFIPFPVLQTERLKLRQLLVSDTEALHVLRSDPEVMKYIQRPLSRSVSDTGLLIRSITDSLNAAEGITWGITLKEKNEIAGTIGFWKIYKDHHRAEIGYLLHPALQGKGLMQEALAAVIDFGFGILQLHSIEARVNPGNESSIKLLQKNNFCKEAHFKEDYLFEGNFYDTFVFSLVSGK